MILHNRSFDQEKSFQKLLKFRTWFCLPCTLHLTMVCFTCGIYFGYLNKTVAFISKFSLAASPWASAPVS